MNKRESRPLISMSLDRHWAYRLGLDLLTYRRMIRRAGGVPKTLFYYRAPLVPDSQDGSLEMRDDADGLLLGGGIDVDPNHYMSGIEQPTWRKTRRQRDEFELDLIRQAILVGRPILGICRGCQLLNVALGGTLRLIGKNRWHRHALRFWKHPVAIRHGSQLGRAVGQRRLRAVRSIHSEAVDQPGHGVNIVARAPDGIPEAIECFRNDDATLFCVGVQWHPELFLTRNQDFALIEAFVEASRQFRRQKDDRRLAPPKTVAPTNRESSGPE